MYTKDNMKIVALFDADPAKTGTKINQLTVQPMSALAETVKRLDISIGIITVPAMEAQNVADQFVAAGIRGILNFAPSVLKVPKNVRIHYADFTAELLSLAFYMDYHNREDKENVREE
jgi:redox-sensing transcriptional repressor